MIEFDDGYFVCEDGRVLSNKGKGGSLREIKGKVARTGYREVLMIVRGKRKYALVHRLVAENFIPNHGCLRTVNHKDGDKLNNNASNLEWMSDSENLKHARDNNLLSTCKINKEIAEMIRSDNGSNRALAKKYGISKTQVGVIRQGRAWL